MLSAITGRLPEARVETAIDVLADALDWGGPTERTAAHGLLAAITAGSDLAGHALLEEAVAGRDLPVLFGDWIRSADAETQQRLVDAATSGVREALVQAVAAGLPEHHPELRPGVDALISERLGQVPAGAFGRDGLDGWTEAARFAAHATPPVRDALIGRAASVLNDTTESNYAAVAALKALATMAGAVPTARAVALYDDIAPFAEGRLRKGPPAGPLLELLGEGALQAAAVQACAFLAGPSSPRTEAAEALLETSGTSPSEEVRRIAERVSVVVAAVEAAR